MRSLLRSVVLWVFGGALYFLCEVAWKMTRGHPEGISWTMTTVSKYSAICSLISSPDL